VAAGGGALVGGGWLMEEQRGPGGDHGPEPTAGPSTPSGAPRGSPGSAGGRKGPIPLRLGDVLKLKKPHPCGDNRWEVLRVGADIRLRCLGCGRLVLIARSDLERRIRAVLPAGTPPPPPPPRRR
jgi:hypothetical protein